MYAANINSDDSLTRISNNVLKMGFMKRSALQLEQKQQIQKLINKNEAKDKTIVKKSQTMVTIDGKSQFIKPEDDDEVNERNDNQKNINMNDCVIKQDSDRPPFIHPTIHKIDDAPDITLYSSVLVEERLTLLEDLRFGRFSFGGQNPEIEKWMVYHECKRMGIDPPCDEEIFEAEQADREEGELSDQREEEFEVPHDFTSKQKPFGGEKIRRTDKHTINKQRKKKVKNQSGRNMRKKQEKRRFGR